MTETRVNPWTDRDVEEFWDSVAGIYRQENERVRDTHDQRFVFAKKWLDLQPGEGLINVTSRDCGVMDFFPEEIQVFITHCEISQGMIDVAKALYPEAKQIKLESYSELPFGDATFGKLLSLETLEHVSSPHRFLTELNRIARPDAILVLSCPPATSELPYQVYSLLLGGHGEGPHRFLPSRRVKRLLAETGWDLLDHKGTLLVPAGPRWLRQFGERIIEMLQATPVSELGIRQFYAAKKRP